MDDSIGRTLAVLEELDLGKDTVVIFHADHGCAQSVGFESHVAAVRRPNLLLATGGLGEGNLWHKFTNYEHSVRVPLIVKVPWIQNLAGTVISAPVELGMINLHCRGVGTVPFLTPQCIGAPCSRHLPIGGGTDAFWATGQRFGPGRRGLYTYFACCCRC